MKNFILLIILFIFQVGASAQSAILKDYLSIKDALVASKSDEAGKEAKNLIKSIQSLDISTLSPEGKKLFTQQKSNLTKLTEAISTANDIEEQRSTFAELSVTIWPIVKSTATPDQILYYDYCPMKQMYWISIDAPIKNPYYGSKMLTCGSISEKSNP